MTHVRRKRLLFLGLIAVIFCVLAAMTPLGARTAMIIKFQIAELSADDSNDEYNTDTERFYVRNRKTIHSLKRMLSRTSWKENPGRTAKVHPRVRATIWGNSALAAMCSMTISLAR